MCTTCAKNNSKRKFFDIVVGPVASQTECCRIPFDLFLDPRCTTAKLRGNKIRKAAVGPIDPEVQMFGGRDWDGLGGDSQDQQQTGAKSFNLRGVFRLFHLCNILIS